MVNFIYLFIWAIKHFNRIIIAFHLDLFGIVQFVCVHFQRNFINVGFLFDNIIWWCNTCSTNAHYTGSVASVGVNKTSFFTIIRLHYLIIHFIHIQNCLILICFDFILSVSSPEASSPTPPSVSATITISKPPVVPIRQGTITLSKDGPPKGQFTESDTSQCCLWNSLICTSHL